LSSHKSLGDENFTWRNTIVTSCLNKKIKIYVDEIFCQQVKHLVMKTLSDETYASPITLFFWLYKLNLVTSLIWRNYIRHLITPMTKWWRKLFVSKDYFSCSGYQSRGREIIPISSQQRLVIGTSRCLHSLNSNSAILVRRNPLCSQLSIICVIYRGISMGLCAPQQWHITLHTEPYVWLVWSYE
jgi:hypothetical protein